MSGQGEGTPEGWARYYAERDARQEYAELMGMARDELDACTEHVKDLNAKIRWLLEYGDLWGDEGVFCFPDGDIWRRG